jgi:acetyltransferase-like isoleucine patch superfamily enzyme
MEAANKLGINVSQHGAMPQILVTDTNKSIGSVNIWSAFSNSIIFFDNRESDGNLSVSIRIHGENSQCIFNDAGKNFVGISILSMRSHRQNFFFGKDSTAVELSVEMEGEDRICVIGDDALISSGIWIRNHDMHSVVDLDDRTIINKEPGDIKIERHVWIGQDVLCVGAQDIGFGSIIGARSFVKRPVPPKSIVAGMPAKIIRQNVSWGRQSGSVSDREMENIDYLSGMTD